MFEFRFGYCYFDRERAFVELIVSSAPVEMFSIFHGHVLQNVQAFTQIPNAKLETVSC